MRAQRSEDVEARGADLDEPRVAGTNEPRSGDIDDPPLGDVGDVDERARLGVRERTSLDEPGARPIAAEDAIPPEDAGKARPGHPAESPRGFGRFVTIAALVILAIIAWAVLF